MSLETAYRELVVLDLTEQLAPGQHEGMEIVRSCLLMLRNLQDLLNIIVHYCLCLNQELLL